MSDIIFRIPDTFILVDSLPPDKAGYGDYEIKFDGLKLNIEFEFFCEISKCDKIGRIVFDGCSSFFVIDHKFNTDFFPPSSDRIYAIDQMCSAERSLSGYMMWLSNSRKTIIVYADGCKVEIDS